MFDRAAALLRPTERLSSDDWARRNRSYPLDAPIPGPRNPSLTPYIIPIERAIDARTHRRIAAVFGTQMSKTELALDVMGNRLDSAPVSMAYIMPSDKVLKEIIEPRINALMETPSLAVKCGRRQTKARKNIAGVRLRLVPAGSASSLAADTLGLIVTDEIDKFAANVKGQGNVVGLADRRGDNYPDFVHFSTSSPSTGPIDIEVDPVSGLSFWSEVDPDDLRSPIWSMWQSGTRYHWAWPCPHCSTYFIPRFRDVKWDKPKDRDGNELPSTAIMASRTAHMVCETCVEKIYDADKEWMNARGVFVAPGQSIDADGNVLGEEPESWTLSFWVSGFCSPFVPWGQRAAEYVEAAQSRDVNAIQTVVNGFGELFVPGDGDVPDWAELMALRADYEMASVPQPVRLATLTVDVQKDRLPFVVRGWGEGETSWLIEAGEILGDTAEQKVWDDLETVLKATYDGLPIRMALIDSGYRPGKKFVVPDHMVYKFCRRFPKLAYATKGASNPMRKPIAANKIDVKIDGKEFKRGLEIRILDTGFFKRWLFHKLRAPIDKVGAWFVPADVKDDYLQQLVSEVEVNLPNGKTKWVQRSKHNHYFDCEAMQGAIAMMLNLKLLHAGPRMTMSRAKAASATATRKRRPIEKPDEIEISARPFDEKTESSNRNRTSRKRGGSQRESIW